MPDEAQNTGLSQKGEEEAMRKKHFDLQLFTDGGEGGAGAAGAGTGAAGNGNGSQGNAGGATYSYEQAEQIAEAIALIVKGGEEKIPQARAIVQKLTDKYPLI